MGSESTPHLLFPDFQGVSSLSGLENVRAGGDRGVDEALEARGMEGRLLTSMVVLNHQVPGLVPPPGALRL